MPKTKMTIELFVDGASRGNPGPASVGAVLYRKGDRTAVSEVSRCIGVATNNVAEYLAVIYGLQEAAIAKADKVILKTDSQLVARQLRGSYKVKSPSVKPFYDVALNMFRVFEDVSVVEIPRKENSRADQLANKALDAAAIF